MDDVEEYEEETSAPASRRFQWTAIGFHACAFVSNVLAAHAQFWDGLSREFGYHTNWRIDRQRFKEEAGYAIERITQAENLS